VSSDLSSSITSGKPSLKTRSPPLSPPRWSALVLAAVRMALRSFSSSRLQGCWSSRGGRGAGLFSLSFTEVGMERRTRSSPRVPSNMARPEIGSLFTSTAAIAASSWYGWPTSRSSGCRGAGFTTTVDDSSRSAKYRGTLRARLGVGVRWRVRVPSLVLKVTVRCSDA